MSLLSGCFAWDEMEGTRPELSSVVWYFLVLGKPPQCRKRCWLSYPLKQQFLMLRPFNTAPHVVLTPPCHKIISLLLHICDFAVVMNPNVNIRYADI